MRVIERVCAMGLCLALAGPAAAFLAENGMSVDQVGPGRFEVRWGGGSNGAPSFWCAAADYAWRGLNLPPATRVYRVSEPPRGSGEGIIFSLDRGDAASRSGLLSLWERDAGRTVAHARMFCNETDR
ncbi:hypothetical protein DXV76_12695 [Rhodobacteraceae bacterium CCMM004]|nr:hypothetical protein DXV76_12695 [Rhodobacteraceae bacterium CCMM004]